METEEGLVTVIKGKDVNVPTSMKMAEDPFAGQYGDGILEPPYNIELLTELMDHSNILSQCVAAMETNIDGFGFTLDPVGKADPENDGKCIPEAEKERKWVTNFFDYCNPDLPFSQIRQRARRDLEATGNAYWEIIRDGKGEISWIEHIESHTMRLTKLDAELTNVNIRIRDDEENSYRDDAYRKRFRRYVQIRNGEKVYFKEFGDPRVIDSRSGKVVEVNVVSQP